MKMTMDDVEPGLRDALETMPNVPIRSAFFRAISPLLMKMRSTGPHEGVQVSVPVRGNGGMRLFTPETRKSDGALLWIHGGGYVLGVAKLDDDFCAQVARELGIVVASVEYRLAPRHPFPAPLEDCHAVWRWLQDNAAGLGIDPGKIAIGGLSAGGGLAAGLVQRVHDDPGQGPVAQWLLAPMIDDRTAARRDLDATEHFVWDNSFNWFGWQSYLGKEPGSPDLPEYASPARRASLAGLPPAWIGVGSIELFRDEDVDYARRLGAAGVDVTLEIVEGAPHGFEAWGANTQIGAAHLRKGREWLSRFVC